MYMLAASTKKGHDVLHNVGVQIGCWACLLLAQTLQRLLQWQRLGRTDVLD
jgi:hypothetical protein